MKLESIDDVLELFGQIGGRGNENCVFYVSEDQVGVSERGTIAKPVIGGVINGLTGGIGGLVGGIIEDAMDPGKPVQEFGQELNLDVLNNYRQFLINETEDTIAIIPMQFKSRLNWKTEGAEVFPESGRVIPKSVIDKIEIKKFMFMTPTIRGLKIQLIDGYKLGFMVATNVKTLPYHIENFKKFSKKYANKK